MGSVLVLVDRAATDGSVCGSTCALLTLARRLGPPTAVLCGPADAASVARLGRFGADTIKTITSTDLDEHPAAARVELLSYLVRRTAPDAVLITSHRLGREIAARLTARLGSGLISDAIDLRMDADGPVAVQSALLGAYRVESRVPCGTPVFTVRTDAVRAVAAPARPDVQRLHLAFSPGVRAVRRIARRPVGGELRPDLATAAIVVAGGRGLGSQQSFGLVGALAEALSGTAGGSHAATELGWCARREQIDQLGTIVHPRLYLALGISGSVRHRAAMQHAETIVAIDRNPAAPIFDLADLGVVGDVHQVVPELLAEIRRRRADPMISHSEETT
ncbi:electron transfer flavoprotein subunit alpha/FixB family protein [Actinoplanes regularis]|uniref:electron transfer flavoprotein subunit alpha/FixB family protein n=1 Tax=Actinoplanes regularis TaxID=52697 RepID=UPI00249FB021|nr:electron transfer flavoprotein subunit alpha/FixB family protein [Actinoplanes regularis]GLW29001.1 electron transfer flavoprotein subunit alpha [Actinoplanes regularis]